MKKTCKIANIVLISALVVVFLPAGVGYAEDSLLRVPSSFSGEGDTFAEKFNAVYSEAVTAENQPLTLDFIDTDSYKRSEVLEALKVFRKSIQNYAKKQVTLIKDLRFIEKTKMALVITDSLKDALLAPSGRYYLFLAREGEKIAGVMLFQIEDELDFGYIVVHPEYEGRGIRKMMWHKAVEKAREEKADIATIRVNSNNTLMTEAMEEGGSARKMLEEAGLKFVSKEDKEHLSKYTFRILKTDYELPGLNQTISSGNLIPRGDL
jgi:ribosomal protein S18 acetylase RimI-like enzyme